MARFVKNRAIILVAVGILALSALSGCVEDGGTATTERTVDAPLNTLALPVSAFDGNYNTSEENHSTEGHFNDHGYWVCENYTITYEKEGSTSLADIETRTQDLGKFNSSDDAEASIKAAKAEMSNESDAEVLSMTKVGDGESFMIKITKTVLGTEYTAKAAVFRVADVAGMVFFGGVTVMESDVVDHARDLAANIESATVEVE